MITEKAKKMAGLFGIAALCLCTMTAGAKETEGHRDLHISIIDEFPPESEMELHILEEEQRAREEEKEDLFVRMTNLIDTGFAEMYLVQEDGSVRKDEGISIELNTAKFFVPDGGSRCFGVPNFSTEIYGEGEWEFCRQEEFYYDYLVWKGETVDYEVTLAIPLMEKQQEGYYLASRIRKEAENKSVCAHILSGMMQTFQGVPYLHVVKEGESLSKIAEKYMGTQEGYPRLKRYDDTSGGEVPFKNQNLIYPGQKIWMPVCKEYDGRIQ